MSGTCPNGGRPQRNRWRPIATALRQQIQAGGYRPGDRLPSSAELQAAFRVSGQTVQHAMNALRNEGLVETRPGHGWFVGRPPEVVRLARLVRPAGPVAGKAWTGCDAVATTVLRCEEASPAVAAELRVAPGTEVWVRERTMRDAGQVVALATSYYPRSLTRGTAIETTDTGPGGGFACLLRLGHEVVRHVERVAAGLAGDDETRRFGRADPPVVFRVVRITLGRSTVLGVIHIVVLADRFELCYELPVPS